MNFHIENNKRSGYEQKIDKNRQLRIRTWGAEVVTNLDKICDR